MSGNSPHSVDLTEEIITAVDLRQRWRGCPDWELAGLVERRVLPAYWHQISRERPDGTIVHSCAVCPSIWSNEYAGEVSYDWEGVIHTLSDVEHVESEYPQLKYKIVSLEAVTQSPPGEEGTKGHWIKCDTLADYWGVSDFDVVDILKSGELRYHEPYGNHIVDIEQLPNGTVHSVDLARWEAENQDRITSLRAPGQAPQPITNQTEVEALYAQVEELRAQVKTLKAELAKQQAAPKEEAKLDTKAEEKVAAFVKGVLEIKADWNCKPDDCQIRMYGYSEPEVEAFFSGLPRAYRRSIKKALSKTEIKIWPHARARPSA